MHPLTGRDDPERFRFDATSAVVSAPTSPHRAAQISLRIDRIVTGNRSVACPLPGSACQHAREGFAFLRGGIGVGISGSNRLRAFTGVIRPIRSNAADVLTGWDLVQKFE